MKVLTNNQYYSQIANVIREQNGTNNTYKPAQMVRALKDLFYEEVEGVPPITFQGIRENLLNYRIDGASGGVGDRTGNLFDFGEWSKNINANRDNSLAKGIDGITITANSNDAFTMPYSYAQNGVYKIYVKPNTNYLLSWVSNNNLYGRVIIFKNGIPDNTHMVIANNNTTKYLLVGTDADTEFITLRFGVETTGDTITYSKIMLNEGSTALPYEPYGYRVPVVVNGKNLLQNNATTQTRNGVTFTVNNDKSISCNGTASSNAFFKIGDIQLKKNCIMSGCPEGGANNSYVMRLYNNGSVFKTDSGNGVLINSEIQNGYAEIRIAAGYTCDNLTFYPMMRLAEIEDNTYEPYIEETTNIYLDNPIRTINDEIEYIDYSEQKHHRLRKNLLQNTATTQTVNGVTFTVNNDKSITCNGVSNITTYIYLNMDFIPKEGITYIYSGCPQNGGIMSYELDLLNPSGIVKQDIGNGISFDSTIKNEYLRVRLRINAGYTCNNLTFYPMIRKADIEDDTYEPYIENTEVDVTLPAIPTIRGTNILSVDTTVQPSNVYIKSRHESSYEAAMRERYEEAQAQLDALESEGE